MSNCLHTIKLLKNMEIKRKTNSIESCLSIGVAVCYVCNAVTRLCIHREFSEHTQKKTGEHWEVENGKL